MSAAPTRRRAGGRTLTAVAVASVAAGVAFRLYSRSDLWLDEALSVDIARLPVGDLLRALRHDGHPPLYYLMLHVWMKVFGDGDEAVRSLSGVLGLATIAPMWLAAKRFGGSACAAAAVVLLATSPFAVRYSTEARMYSLVMLLVVVGWLAVRRALERPSLARLAPVAVVAGLLALSHYWSFYLLAATVALLFLAWRRGQAAAGRVALAVVSGAVLFLPWLPSFLVQAGSTGTPWGRPERITNVLAITFTDFGGGTYASGEAKVLGFALVVLVGLAVLGRALDERRIELDLRTRPGARAELAAVLGTLAIANVVGYATAGAFASRYTAVVFPLVVLVAAFGWSVVTDRRVAVTILVALAALGIVGDAKNLTTQRTQAGQLAAYIGANGAPGDVVAYCPDQLGPSVTRMLPDDRVGMNFPDGGDPRFVDWKDYAHRMEHGDPARFAASVDERAGRHTVWLVWAAGYRTLDHRCETLVDALKARRPGGTAVVPSGNQFEHAWLYQYGPASG